LPAEEYLIKAYKCTLKKEEEGAKTRKFYGRLYVGSSHLCYYSAVFGYIYKRVYQFQQVRQLKKAKEPFVGFKFKLGNKKYTFCDFEKDLAGEAFAIIETIYEKEHQPHDKGETVETDSQKRNSSGSDEESKPNGTLLRERQLSLGSVSGPDFTPGSEEAAVADLSLSQEDWALILEGSECVTYMKDQFILREGENFDSIYQIGNGIVRIEKRFGEKVEILGTMGTSEMFGEISFLGGDGASVDIVADQNNVDIYIIGKAYIEGFFKHKDTGIEGKFYKIFMFGVISAD